MKQSRLTCAPLISKSFPSGRLIKSPITLGEGIFDVFQPPLMPLAFKTIVLQSFEAGAFALSSHAGFSRSAKVPPQKIVAGVQLLAIVNGRRAEALDAG